MNTAVITLMGVTVHLQYDYHPNNFIQWSLTPEDRGNNPLLEILLRIHYNDYIESMLRENYFERQYEEHMRLSALEDIPF